jgi:hypothetical protein
MHGFFMDIRLYSRLKSIVEPALTAAAGAGSTAAYDDYVKTKVKQKIDEATKGLRPALLFLSIFCLLFVFALYSLFFCRWQQIAFAWPRNCLQ